MTAAETTHTAHPPAAASTTLQGLIADLDDASRVDVLEKAFDFRGDVTLTLADGSTVSGYLFDRQRGTTAADSVVRLLPQEGNQKQSIRFADIRRIEFGKDAAHGKTWENWVKRYIEKKTKGETASLEAEKL
jgi:hypothetical protein